MENKTYKRGKVLLKLPIFCRVKPLARPRANFYKKTVFQPLETQKELRNEIDFYSGHNIDKECIVDCDIYISTKKITDNKVGDIDNLLKAIFDALVDREVITNDNLIVGTSAYKYIAAEDYCVITIYEVIK